MYRWENTMREDRFRSNPSFSSSLLDEIYRSIDEGDRNCTELKFSRETVVQKQNKNGIKSANTRVEDEDISNLRQACLAEKWMDKKVREKLAAQRKQPVKKIERISKHDYDYDHDDTMFFSSGSNSSESSSGGLSSSETESLYGSVPTAACFSSRRPKPVRMTVTARSESTEKTLFYEQNENGSSIKAKSRALKIYYNLKKVKQPISPGSRISSFLNSLFTARNAKKNTKNSTINGVSDDLRIERKLKPGQLSTCSSASSFSRSCLSQHSPATRHELRNGVKRTVRFYPVSVIFDEDSQPCGTKSLTKQEDSRNLTTAMPNAWKIGKTVTQSKSLTVNEQENDSIARKIMNISEESQGEEDEDDHDDGASCSSSDLFELDHLAVMANELPVYETTNVSRNRAIAKGLLV